MSSIYLSMARLMLAIGVVSCVLLLSALVPPQLEMERAFCR